jgi:hypothetical protein
VLEAGGLRKPTVTAQDARGKKGRSTPKPVHTHQEGSLGAALLEAMERKGQNR